MITLTTPLRMKTTAPHLAKMEDEALILFIEDATFEVSKLSAPVEYLEKLTRYLAIHLASINNRTVLKEKLEGLEKTYADTDVTGGLLSTPYGAEYKRLLDELPGNKKRKTLNLTVL